MLSDFKAFLMRGNIVELAVGIIIGGAFAKIVSSLVNDMIMPPVGLLLGGVDFSELELVLREASPAHEAVSLRIGLFVSSIVDFSIVAFAIFMIVRLVTRTNPKS